MVNGTTEPDLLSEAQQWLRQRDEYRDRLLKELEDTRARVSQIEKTLAELGHPLGPTGEATDRSRPLRKTKYLGTFSARTFNAKKANIPELITHVVSETEAGLTSGGIVKGVIALRTMPSANVYPTIYRMRDDGRLRLAADKYFPPEEDAGQK